MVFNLSVARALPTRFYGDSLERRDDAHVSTRRVSSQRGSLRENCGIVVHTSQTSQDGSADLSLVFVQYRRVPPRVSFKQSDKALQVDRALKYGQAMIDMVLNVVALRLGSSASTFGLTAIWAVCPTTFCAS